MEIKIHSPLKGTEVSLLRADWKEYIRIRKLYLIESGIVRPDLAFPEPCVCVWEGGTPPYTLTFSSGEDFRVVSAAETRVPVWNLMTGQTYALRIADSCGTDAETIFRTQASPRLLRLPSNQGGPVNFRDLGGWEGPPETRIRQGLVYRGSECCIDNCFSEENRRFLSDFLRIRTELDMRYPEQVEADKTVSSPLGDGVRWIHIPINAYRSFEPDQCVLFRRAVQVFADERNYPLFFHCQAGCDRTGEIAILLKALCGEEPENIFLDYEFTSLSGYPRTRRIGYLCEWLQGIASFSSKDLSFREQVERYLTAIGVSPDEIASIRRNLLLRFE